MMYMLRTAELQRLGPQNHRDEEDLLQNGSEDTCSDAADHRGQQ